MVSQIDFYILNMLNYSTLCPFLRRLTPVKEISFYETIPDICNFNLLDVHGLLYTLILLHEPFKSSLEVRESTMNARESLHERLIPY